MPKNKIKVYTKDRGVLDIKVVPNQKVIEIHKVKEKGAGILDIAANKRAMKNLTANAYTLYMHFVLNIHHNLLLFQVFAQSYYHF